jgi:acetyltransferase-like isoleucine patch superfamily enzyme
MPIKSLFFLKRIVKRIACPAPAGMKRIGIDSYIQLPRKISGTSCIEIGDRTNIHPNSWISAITKYGEFKFSPMISIGSDVYIGHNVCITSMSSIFIADECVLSEHVYITDLFHGLNPNSGLIMEQKLNSKGGVKIGKSSFIGYRACIMPGVTLGKHCVVGANSVVTQSFPDYSMVAGCPAKIIKKYCFEQQNWIVYVDD